MDEAHQRKEQEDREREWREEVERREQEYKEAEQRKIDAASKMIDFITSRLQEFINIDFQKKLLSYHGSFDALNLFREIDADNKGYLNAADL